MQRNNAIQQIFLKLFIASIPPLLLTPTVVGKILCSFCPYFATKGPSGNDVCILEGFIALQYRRTCIWSVRCFVSFSEYPQQNIALGMLMFGCLTWKAAVFFTLSSLVFLFLGMLGMVLLMLCRGFD